MRCSNGDGANAICEVEAVSAACSRNRGARDIERICDIDDIGTAIESNGAGGAVDHDDGVCARATSHVLSCSTQREGLSAIGQDVALDGRKAGERASAGEVDGLCASSSDRAVEGVVLNHRHRDGGPGIDREVVGIKSGAGSSTFGQDARDVGAIPKLDGVSRLGVEGAGGDEGADVEGVSGSAGAGADVLASSAKGEGRTTCSGQHIALDGRKAGEGASGRERDLIRRTSSCDGCCPVVLGGGHRHLRTQGVSRSPTCALGGQGDGVGASNRSTRDINTLLQQQRVPRCPIEGIGPSDATNHLDRHRAACIGSREVGAAGKANHRDGSLPSQGQCSGRRNRRGVNRDREGGSHRNSCIAFTSNHGVDASIYSLSPKINITGSSELQPLNPREFGKLRIVDEIIPVRPLCDQQGIDSSPTVDGGN